MAKISEKLAGDFGLRLRDAERLIALLDEGNSPEEIAAGIRGMSAQELESFAGLLSMYREREKNRAGRIKKICITALALLLLLVALPGLPYMAGLICLGTKNYESAIGCYRVSDRLYPLGSFFNAGYMAEEGVYVQKAEDAVAKRDRFAAAEAFAQAGRDYLSREQYYLAGRELLDAGDFDGASAAFDKAEGYRDAANKIPLAYLEQGRELVNEKKYSEAYELFLSMKGTYIAYFGESGEQNGLRELLYEAAYYYGTEQEQAGKIPEAIELYSAAGSFADAQSREYSLRMAYSAQLIGEEKYAEASEVLRPIRSYENNFETWQDCAYKAAEAALAEADFAFAAERYLELGDYEDSEEKANGAMYSYVQENQNSADENTYAYLCILRKQKYLDAAEIYETLYKWEIVIDAISLSADDRETMQTKFALDEPVCFHFTLLGGDKAKEKFIYTYTYQNGYTQSGSISLSVGEQGVLYHNNSSNLCYDTPGTFTVDFYDSDGNQVGHAAIEYLE